LSSSLFKSAKYFFSVLSRKTKPLFKRTVSN
jgi:hypothetical protein